MGVPASLDFLDAGEAWAADAKRNGEMMRADTYAELFLLNKNVDSLIRVLQRIESLGIVPGALLKRQESLLEKFRATLNRELLEAIFKTESDNCRRLIIIRGASEESRPLTKH
jgi:hypothetical protein